MAAAQNGVRGGRLGLQATLYNVGRITSYVVAGVIVGLLGSALGDMIDLPSWSLWLRGITGLVLVLLGLACFLEGLERALFPLGKLMAEQLTAPEFLGVTGGDAAVAGHWQAYVWVYLFAFAIGFST